MRGSPQAQIVLVGDEIVSGHVTDEIGPMVSERLQSIGFELRAIMAIPDRAELIASTVAEALSAKIDVLIFAGGLGPTSDDLTRQGLAEGLGVSLREDEAAARRIRSHFEDRGREFPESSLRQALMPEGARSVPNPVGTAPGLALRSERTHIYALPGVPREFEAMFTRSVSPELGAEFRSGAVTASRRIRIVGLPESDVARSVESVGIDEDVKVRYLARDGEVELNFATRKDDAPEAEERVVAAVRAARESLGDHVLGEGEDTLVGVLRDLLGERNWKLATAESCTGGLIGKLITDLAGSSEFYLGGLCVYHDDEKARLLGIERSRIATLGAVSATIARDMAIACRERLAADVAISTTGIAGPGGGSAEKPVGLVYVGVALPDRCSVTRHSFRGERHRVRSRAARAALDELRRVLSGLSPLGDPAEIAESP